MAIAINTAQLAGLLGKKHGISHVVIAENSLNSFAFNRYFLVIINLTKTILKYNNPDAKLFLQNKHLKFF
jgi:hypothetical protein